MHDLAISLSKSLLGYLAIQVFFVVLFLIYLRSPQKHLLPDGSLPKTAVILCLRGASPFLSKCLLGLLNQNYPNYDLKLIVDNQEDPAWEIAHDIILEQQATNVQVSVLRIPRPNCSLKCSSLVQAVSDLDDSYKVVALLDADTVPHPDWLRELVGPLNNPKIGATTGNRWYSATGSWASLVRYLWNVAAVVQMYVFGGSWGGTLAVKTELLHQTGLVDRWGRAFCEDIPIRRALGKKKMKVKLVPSLIMVNRQDCDLSGLVNSLKRQLLCYRLYHPCWWGVVSDAISSVVVPILVFALLVTALLTAQWDTAAVLLASFGSYTVGLILLAIALDIGVSQVVSKYGEQVTELSPDTLIRMFIAVPLTQWVYGLAMLSSLWMPKVRWCGVTYLIKGPWNIRLVQYRPYPLLDPPVDGEISV
jgi:cellulose synthase/poly-beta-1,6-N-acetylglucosamine synthase-like glycosyltransferase